MKFRLLLFLIFGFSSTFAVAQGGEPLSSNNVSTQYREFKSFSDRHGLTGTNISSIFQDSLGFLWIGTGFGLNRFDGYQFLNYYHEPENPSSIAESGIVAIHETSTGELWVVSVESLNKYNRKDDNFTRFSINSGNGQQAPTAHYLTTLLDREGNIWLVTNAGGLSKFDTTTHTFVVVFENSEVIDKTSITSVAENGDGELFVSTGNMVGKLDVGRKQIVPIQEDIAVSEDDRVTHLMIDASGLFWIGKTKGVVKFDPRIKNTTRYFDDKSLANDRIISSRTHALFEAKDGTIWVGMQNRICRYEPATDSFMAYRNDGSNPRELEFGTVKALFEDESSQLWFGGTFTGLTKFDQKSEFFQQFKHDSNDPGSLNGPELQSIYIDKDNIPWVLTFADGINIYDPIRKKFNILKTPPNINLTTLQSFKDGIIWAGGYKGELLTYDPKSRFFSKFRAANGIGPTSLINEMLEDKDGYLWIATTKGLYGLDRKTNLMTEHPIDPKHPRAWQINNIRTLAEGPSGEIWVGTNYGFCQFKKETGSCERYVYETGNVNSLSNDLVVFMRFDAQGQLWIGTLTGGLNRFDPKTEKFELAGKKYGLPEATLFSMAQDNNGIFWIGSDRGLVRLDPKTGEFQRFQVEDGITQNEFNEDCAIKDKEGNLYFGGIKGFVKFNPNDFVKSSFKPKVIVSNIRVLENPLESAPNASELSELNLSWRDYVVSFDFAALDYSNTTRLRYQWKLEGFDDDWIVGGERRTATYSNLSGGNYVLKVKATNADGVWGDEIIKLKLNVSPPFYRTIWFYCLVFLLLGGLIWLTHRFRVSQVELKHKTQVDFSRLLIASQESERKRIALELHDGLGQNIVVIKNLASIVTKKLNLGEKKDEVIKELKHISEASILLLNEVRSITHNLRPPMLNRIGLTKTIDSMLNNLSNVVEIKKQIDSIDGVFDENEEISFYRILQEILNNAMKHANAKKISVIIKRDSNQLVTEISDDGKGFDVQKVSNQKSGLGLISLKERANLLHGTFNIESKIDLGTTVRIVIPISNNNN